MTGGFITLEWTVALSLTLLLVALTAQLATALLRFGFFEAFRAQWNQEAALSGGVLAGEIGRASSPADWSVQPGDSLRIRAFRGHAWICAFNSPTSVTVVYQGDRNPNPAKDSVLIHSAAPGVRAVPLRSRRASAPGCSASFGRQTEEWDLGGPVPREGVLRLFESGTYSVSNGALRYRVGRGGRQPVVGSQYDTASGLMPRTTLGGGKAAELSLVSTPGPYRPSQLRYWRAAYPRRSIP